MGERRHRLIWSPEAEDDLFSVWSYGAEEWSPIAADDHLQNISMACTRLFRNPELGKSRSELIDGMRSILVDPHVVFYRIKTTTVEIIRVLHQREDVENIFS
jgi:toxin ParE1/3/4